MTKRPLELEIRRKGRRQEYIDVEADPADYGALQDILTNWLERNKWGPGRWHEFTMDVRYAGESKRRGTVSL